MLAGKRGSSRSRSALRECAQTREEAARDLGRILDAGRQRDLDLSDLNVIDL